MTQPNILIIGAGAIGSFYGSLLHAVGCRVDVVVRSDAELIRSLGFKLDSALGDLSWHPRRIYVAGDALECVPDYLILATKVLAGVDRIALMRPWLGNATQIVLIQNGLDIEQEILDALPSHPLISCIAFIAVSRTAPAVIRHDAYGRLTMGNFPAGTETATEQLAALFRASGIAVKLSDNIVRERWKKCVWNASFNPLSVLANGADTGVMLNRASGETLVRALMAEVIATAKSAGHDLPAAKLIEDNLHATRNMPPYQTSMALDYLNGRPIELDAILGNVVRTAHQHRVAVPHLETMLTALRLRE